MEQMGNCSPAISGLFLGRKLETHPTGIRGESDEFGGGRMIAKNVGDRKRKSELQARSDCSGCWSPVFSFSWNLVELATVTRQGNGKIQPREANYPVTPPLLTLWSLGDSYVS